MVRILVRHTTTLLIGLALVVLGWAQVVASARGIQQQPLPPLEIGFGSALAVRDQLLTNNSVTIDMVSLIRDGWVIIHPTNELGQPQQEVVLGSLPVEAGQNSEVQVILNTSVLPGTQLVAMLYFDNGTPGMFEFAGADAPVQVSQQLIAMPFMILGAATPAVGQLPVTGLVQAESWRLCVLAAVLLFIGLGLRWGVGNVPEQRTSLPVYRIEWLTW